MLATLKGQVGNDAGQPISGATVTLRGPAPEPDSGTHLSWTRQISGFKGTLDECWQRVVAPAVSGITKERFRNEVKKHNHDSLFDVEGSLVAGRTYLLPEYHVEQTGGGFVWDRPLTGFNPPPRVQKELNLSECHERYVQGQGVKMGWREFSRDVVTRNKMEKEKRFGTNGYFIFPDRTYALPRSGPRIFTRIAITDERGEFRFPCLGAGAYKLHAQADEYDSHTTAPLDLNGDKTLDITLGVKEPPVPPPPPPNDGPKGVPAGTDNTLAELASNARHLFTFGKAARTLDVKGSGVIELRGGASLVAGSDISGCQGKLILPGERPDARGVIAVTYDWGRDADRTWEIVFRLIQPGYGLLLSHPDVVEPQRIIECLGFDLAGNFFLQPAATQAPISLPGIGGDDVGKTVYAALSFTAGRRELIITWGMKGDSEARSTTLPMSKGQIAGGRLILGGAGRTFFAGQKRTAGIEIHHFAVYGKVLEEEALKKRLAMARII